MVAGRYAAVADFRPQGYWVSLESVVYDRGALLASANAKNTTEIDVEPTRQLLHAVYRRQPITAKSAIHSSYDPGHNFQAPAMPFARLKEVLMYSMPAKWERSIRTGSGVPFVDRRLTDPL